jgi:ribose transport system substrate-binding protein
MVTWSPCAVLALLASSVALAACGSSSDDGSTTASATSSSSGASQSASKARAEAGIKQYVGQPSAFPLATPLKKLPPKGSRVAFMDCGTPVCGLFKQIITPAAKLMGLDLYSVKAGNSAESVNAAFNTVAEQKPAAIINTALDPVLWQQSLSKIKAEKIPIISTGIINGDQYGLTTAPNAVMFGKGISQAIGKAQADWIYVQHGDKANVAFYYPPELAFTAVVKDAFMTEMKSLCPGCKVRLVKIPVATLGNTAPQRIVSDLQSNPDTNVATTAQSEVFNGLPAALKTAGLKVDTVGTGGGPVNLQYVKAGQQTTDLAMDFAVLSWTLVDAAARGITGEEVPPEEAKGLPPLQFLQQADITFDPSRGWTGYPDFPQRFAKLWGVKAQ